MTAEQLNLIAAWASIISLIVSTISLFYLRSIKANIIKFRRKQRLRGLIAEISRAATKPGKLPEELLCKLESLKWNLPTYPWSKLTRRGRLTLEVHKHIDHRNLIYLREALLDLSSFSEEP